MPSVHFLRLRGYPIYRQLILEEALLRADNRNWCIFNDGTAPSAIVMGISGKPDQLIHIPEARTAGVQVIKRFTGGGTVVVDQDTILCSLICSREDVPQVEPFPQPIMKWSEAVYSHVFGPDFSLRQNDYVFGQRKFGGNAQAITSDRWLHHTSFLWDYKSEKMSLLKHPPKAPEYRQGRPHEEFVVKLKEWMGDRAAFGGLLREGLENEGFDVVEVGIEEVEGVLEKPHLCGTKLVEL